MVGKNTVFDLIVKKKEQMRIYLGAGGQDG
jgi:hypothetical protein